MAARPLGIAQYSVSTSSELAVASGEAGSARPGEVDTTNADVTAVARPAGEAQPLGIAKQSTTTEFGVAVSSGEAGPSLPRAKSTPSADVTAVTMLAGEARPPGFEAGLSWSSTSGTTSTAEMAADAKSVVEARPFGIAKYSPDRFRTRSVAR